MIADEKINTILYIKIPDGYIVWDLFNNVGNFYSDSPPPPNVTGNTSISNFIEINNYGESKFFSLNTSIFGDKETYDGCMIEVYIDNPNGFFIELQLTDKSVKSVGVAKNHTTLYQEATVNTEDLFSKKLKKGYEDYLHEQEQNFIQKILNTDSAIKAGMINHKAPGFQAGTFKTNNPIKNNKELKHKMLNSEANLLSAEDLSPSNRTLVVVHGANNEANDEYQERVARLVSSLNTEQTIKAVVISTNGSEVIAGVNFTRPKNEEETPEWLKDSSHLFIQLVEVRDARPQD